MLLCAAVLLVLAATLTPQGETTATAGSAGSFWCLRCRPRFLVDALANVALFVPAGAAFAALRRPRRAVLLALAAALALSGTIELLQLAGLPGGRHASLFDVAANGAGAALGAWLLRALPVFVTPSARRAAWLAGSWTAGSCLALGVTAWALTVPVTSSVSATSAPGESQVGATGWRGSPLPFTPGYGWYTGEVQAVTVNGMDFPHVGSGPVIVQAPAVPRLAARLVARGADHRDAPVPLLFVHEAGDSLPRMMLATSGDDLLLRSSRRAGRLGFAEADLRMQSVFPADAAAAPITVTARSTPAELYASVRAAGVTRDARLLLTPTLGWAILQAFVDATAPAAALLTSLWIGMLVFPVAYWAWWSERHRATTAISGAVLLALAFYLLPRHFGLSLVPTWQWLVASAAFVLGLASGALSVARYDARASRGRA